MYALCNFSFTHFNSFSKRAALAMLASVALLSGCGGGGDAGSDPLPESITIISLDGPSGVTVNTSTSFTCAWWSRPPQGKVAARCKESRPR